MLVYCFVPFIVSNRYLLFWVSNVHNSVTVQNRTHVYMNFFHHKDLGNHLLQLCPKVVKHSVYFRLALDPVIQTPHCSLCYCIRHFWRGIFFFAAHSATSPPPPPDTCTSQKCSKLTLLVEQNFITHKHILQAAQNDDANKPSSRLAFRVRISVCSEIRLKIRPTVYDNITWNFPRVLYTIGVCQCYCILSSKDNIGNGHETK